MSFLISLKKISCSDILKSMEWFEIQGGKRLKGKIEVRGSKNAATPILAATLLTSETCVLKNIPLVEDVFSMMEIMKSMGSEIKWIGKHSVSIRNRLIDPRKINFERVGKIRSSVLFLGVLSARCGKFKIISPGGCVIGARPMGTHFDALIKMGVRVKRQGEYYIVDARFRKATEITLKEFSVTATENAMMLAAALPGKTIIKIAAAEPHVEDLGKFLIKIGAGIKGLGTHTLEITGIKKTRGARHEIIPDANEAATFLVLGVAAKSAIRVHNARAEHLDLVLEKLREFGADFHIGKNYIDVLPTRKIKAVKKIDTRPYPGIPTDIQAPLGVLATQAKGETLIFDTMFEGRFNYLGELEKMGGCVKILNPHQALISGPTKLQGSVIKSFDLRAGASLIIAALIAVGKTIIEDVYQVDRGYEKIEERLRKLGAEIKRAANGK